MRHSRPDSDRATTRTREQLESEHGTVYDLRALAARFVLLRLDGQKVVVRQKDDGRIGTFRFQNTPPYFFEFRLLAAHDALPQAG
jgi:hypothetical protein